MKAIGVIPARWASTRFEGKVLADIHGKPMLQCVWERVERCSLIDEVIIACDDARVMDAAHKFGAKTVMTAKHHASGSDRIAEVIDKIKADVIVNIQGDEPLIHHQLVDDLVVALIDDKNADIATVVKRIANNEEFENPNVVKAVVDQKDHALYFSRAAIPFNRDGGEVQALKHIGLYAYRKDALKKFTQLPASALEQAEKLEQLRALEAGMKIKCIMTETETIGVDTPEDLEEVKKRIKR